MYYTIWIKNVKILKNILISNNQQRFILVQKLYDKNIIKSWFMQYHKEIFEWKIGNV